MELKPRLIGIMQLLIEVSDELTVLHGLVQWCCCPEEIRRPQVYVHQVHDSVLLL